MLSNFFAPKSIAVIGASRHPKKIGNVIVKNLVEHRYRGRIFPVNPAGGVIYGKKVYSSVNTIPAAVDLAVIVVPAPLVLSVVKECGEKRIKAAVIISAGFREEGPAGRQREQSIIRLAGNYHIRLLGPNCLGLIVPQWRMNASFAQGLPAKGGIAVLSQSGAMAVAITDWAMSSGLGFSALVSLGNKADINEEELLHYFGSDDSTNVITMYLESLATGRSLLRTIKRVSQLKPVIILMPGRSEQAQRAVISHTGALAGSYEVQHAAFRAAGAIVAETLEELFMYTQLFQKVPLLSSGRVAIVTNAGGPGVLATDAVTASRHLNLAILSEKTKRELTSFLPAAATSNNPVDVVGDASAARYKRALDIIINDSGVDAVIALLTHQYVTDADKIAEALIQAQQRRRSIPIVASFIGGAGVESGRHKLTQAKVLHFPFPEKAVQVLDTLRQYQLSKQATRSFPDVAPLQKGHPVVMLGKQAERLVSRYVSGVMPSVLVRSVEQAVAKDKQIGYPLVAKVISRQAVHKTDADLVKVNLIDEAALRTTLTAWEAGRRWHFGKDEGFLLQPFRPGSLELLIGTKRDAVIGPYVVVGLGGIFAESMASVSLTPLPITATQADELLNQGLLGRILSSSRGSRLPRQSLTKMLVSVSRLMMERPAIQECDLNPVMVSPSGLEIADIRLVIIK